MTVAASISNPDLALDQQSLSIEELSIPALTREVGLQKKPTPVIRSMMNMLEKKRQAKGYGWSRAWNKYDMNVFRTHVCVAKMDDDYLAPLLPFIQRTVGDLSDLHGSFLDDLFGDPSLMAFTFYHNSDTGDTQYEGLTLSLGRKILDDRTKRDRVDIVLEDLRNDGQVDGIVDRARVYVCPWETYKDKKFFLHEDRDLQGEKAKLTQDLYAHAVGYYHRWKADEGRQWSHWSTRYIDYFGARTFIPKGSSFT